MRRPADLLIYLAGADPFQDDRLGRAALARAGLRARDRLVFGICSAGALPVAAAMAGGYAKNIADTVDIHFVAVDIAAQHLRLNR